MVTSGQRLKLGFRIAWKMIPPGPAVIAVQSVYGAIGTWAGTEPRLIIVQGPANSGA